MTRFSCYLFLVAGLFLTKPVAAQDYNIDVPKEIVILQSTKSYPAALKTAREAAAKLHLKLDLAGNQPNAKTGLSLSKTDCNGDGGPGYPCYYARGDGNAENSHFISIEYSTAYQGFAKGYYIVVAAIGAPGSPLVRTTRAAAQRLYPDAYAKPTSVWRGCMH